MYCFCVIVKEYVFSNGLCVGDGLAAQLTLQVYQVVQHSCPAHPYQVAQYFPTTFRPVHWRSIPVSSSLTCTTFTVCGNCHNYTTWLPFLPVYLFTNTSAIVWLYTPVFDSLKL